MAKHSNVCYVRETDGSYTPRKDAVGVKNGFGADIFRSKGLYYEGQTGIFICGEDRINGFLQIQLTPEEKAGRFAANVQSLIDKYGLSPRYTQPEVMKHDVFPHDDSKILSPTLYHKEKCRFTRVHDENGIQLYTMDKDKSSYPTLYTPCKGWMVGICGAHDKQRGIEYLSQPGFDLYASIVEKYEESLKNPEKWADVGVAEFLDRREEADEHNAPIREMRDRERQENSERRERERREREERAAAEYKAAIEGAERALINGQRVVNTEIGGKDLFLQLFRENFVDVPLKTQGWIKSSLSAVQVNDDGNITYWRAGRPSTVIRDLLRDLTERVAVKYANVRGAECEPEDGNGDEDEMEALE